MDTYDTLMQQIAAGIPDRDKDAFKRRIFRAMNSRAIDEGQAQQVMSAFNEGLTPRQLDLMVGLTEHDPVVVSLPDDECMPTHALSAGEVTILDYASYGAGRGEITEIMGLSTRDYDALIRSALDGIGAYRQLTRRPLARYWRRYAADHGIEHDPVVPKQLALFRSADVVGLWEAPLFSDQHEAIMSRYARGLSQEQIGRELGCGRHTIIRAMRTIRVILGVGSRKEAVDIYRKMQQGAA